MMIFHYLTFLNKNSLIMFMGFIIFDLVAFWQFQEGMCLLGCWLDSRCAYAWRGEREIRFHSLS